MELMKVTAYVLDGHQFDIRPAPLERAWMDATDNRFAYRCLPLAIANAHGWELLCSGGFTARWDGWPTLKSISIWSDPGTAGSAISHFGHGILTFHIPCLFRTEPGVDLMVQGPINRPKDAIAPLSGIVETDWAPYTFTMNWKFTRPGVLVRFEKGEPICHIWPLRRGALEAVEPEVRPLSEAPIVRAAIPRMGCEPAHVQYRVERAGFEGARPEMAKVLSSRLDARRQRARRY